MADGSSESLPLMRGLPAAPLPAGVRLILASGSPRRAELLTAAGYEFLVQLPSEQAEDAPQPGESAESAVRRLAWQKASDVAGRLRHGWVLAADTLGCCDGQLLGKPRDRDDAARMLRLLRGRAHQVWSGLCLWDAATGQQVVDAVCSNLQMTPLDNAALAAYLDTGRWRGKAGGFGYQDGNDWLRVGDCDSESNVVGLPMERLAEMITEFGVP